MNANKILIFDFGSQTTHLIARRLKDLGIETAIIDPNTNPSTIRKTNSAGLIFSGGPASVYAKNAPTVNKKILTLNIPILGICYGWQLIAYLLGSKVKSEQKEYGPTDLIIKNYNCIFYGLPNSIRVFESHGDTVLNLPKGFRVVASTGRVKLAAVANNKNTIFGVQFHPEMHHTQGGQQILKNFATKICNLSLKPKKINTDLMISEIKAKVGSADVIGALSGGTDSAVAATLTVRAIGKRFIPVYIDNGLMRIETLLRIKNDFPKLLGVGVKVVRAKNLFLKSLKGVSDPEKKRKIIGHLYIKLFEQEISNNPKVKFLLQGTTYADFIHSQGSERSAHIKSHHNVGGLPKNMKLKLLEPLRYYYTDEVRKIGALLDLPQEVIYQQPYPGPGHAIRIVGAVTKKRLDQQAMADKIVVEELQKSGWYEKVFQCCSIMTGTKSTAIKGDSRFYGEVAAIRILSSKDRMTADWVRLPEKVLARISTRIVNEVPAISRVVYDITSKPPATMEWE